MGRFKITLFFAFIWAFTFALYCQTAVDHFYNPRSAGFLQLVDGAGDTNFVRGYYADQGDYEERATITAPGQTAVLESSIDIVLNPQMLFTTQITIRGNHSLQIMISPDNGTTWYNFTDPAIKGVLSPAYNNATHDAFVGPMNSSLSIDFRKINQAGFPQLRIRFQATAIGTPNPDGKDRVALLNEMDNWESALNPVDGIKVDFDNSTAIVNVDNGFDVRGNIIGIYRSTDGGNTWQYQGDTNGYFFQQDVTNGVQYTYAAERRDVYGNKSARVNASPGQATCDGRPGETRITGINNGGTNVVLQWFPRNGTEVPCGTATAPLGWYEIYEGNMGQPLSTFSLVGIGGPTDTSWSGPMPSGNKCYIVLAVAADGTTKEQDMTP